MATEQNKKVIKTLGGGETPISPPRNWVAVQQYIITCILLICKNVPAKLIQLPNDVLTHEK